MPSDGNRSLDPVGQVSSVRCSLQLPTLTTDENILIFKI